MALSDAAIPTVLSGIVPFLTGLIALFMSGIGALILIILFAVAYQYFTRPIIAFWGATLVPVIQKVRGK